MRTREFKGVRLAVEDHQSLLSIQREVQKWADIDDKFVVVSDESDFYNHWLQFMAKDARVAGLQICGVGLEHLPAYVRNLGELKTLLIHNNGFSELPAVILQQAE